MKIEDGTGRGYTTGVTNTNRLKTSSIVSTQEHFVNHHDGQSYSAGIQASPTAGASIATCIGYIKNIGDTDMLLSEIVLSVATTNVTVSIILNDEGIPTNTSEIELVNRNASSGNTAQVLSYKGADGLGIGGMSGGGVVSSLVVIAGQPSKYYSQLSGIIVPKNKIITVWASGNCTTLTVGTGVSFHITDK